MNYDYHLVSHPWADYELLDSGDGMKLERFGAVTLARPETQALWRRRLDSWGRADGTFTVEEGKGRWQMKREVPQEWQAAWKDVRMALRLGSAKHTGLFPEQEPNWQWLRERAGALRASAVLNLFGYTGLASIVAAKAGATVTHVDASKQTLDWAHENARLSGLPDDAVRWMPDDALAFVKREVRRKAKYDGIILDPPAFGRGPKGEVWHIEQDLPALLPLIKDLLSDEDGSFFLISGYAAGYAARSLAQAVESAFGPVSGTAGELHIQESGSDRVVPSGIYCRFVR